MRFLSAAPLVIALAACGAPHSHGDQSAQPDGSAGASDAGTDSGSAPVTCGATTCRGGATCVAGVCEHACTGYRVPGDYATLASAVRSLYDTGGTICVGEGSFAEPLVAEVAAGKTLSVIGVSPARTVFTGTSYAVVDGNVAVTGLTAAAATVTANVDRGTTSLTDIEFTGPATVRWADAVDHTTPAPLRFAAVKFDAGLQIQLDPVDTPMILSIDASEIVGGIQVGATVAGCRGGYLAQMTLSLTNNFIHDGAFGFQLPAVFAGTATCSLETSLSVTNNTFTRLSTAALAFAGFGASQYNAVSIYNNLLLDSRIAITNTTSYPFLLGSNVLHGNTTNYDGVTAGPGTLEVDPRIDSEAPPVLIPGSPARGAADPSKAPALDFWGSPRGTSPDPGAVQSHWAG